MTRTCRSPNCQAPTATRFSSYCTIHRARLRRHGAPDQRPVTKAELASYVRMVAGRREKNPSNPLWGHLEDRWRVVGDHAVAILASFQQGKAGSAHERKAAGAVMKLSGDVVAHDVVDTALAMYLLQEDQPRRFRTDAAFRAQLVKRVQALGNVSAGSYWDDKANRARRVYRDTAPRAVAVMGGWLAEAFGVAGLRLARLEQQDRDQKQGERAAVAKALEELV